MIETTTICCTHTRALKAWRLCAAAVKNSVAAAWSGEGPVGIDHHVDSLQGLGQAAPGDDVHARCSRHRHRLVSSFTEHLDDITPDATGPTGDGDLPGCLLDCSMP